MQSRAALDRALTLIEQLMHADDIAVSLVVAGERCVQTLSTHDGDPTGERFCFDDYPTTERVVLEQTLGQVLEGDSAADPAELAVMRKSGFGAVLLAPIVFRGETTGLLEIYRRTARPWNGIEVDQVRMLANQLSAVLSGPGLAAAEPGFVADTQASSAAEGAVVPEARRSGGGVIL